MNFSGTIDDSGGMTMTRLIERIVHSDTPGELRLHDEATGRRATVAVRRGAVQEVSFGELQGDSALTAISQATPWSFEFVPDEAGASPSHPAMFSRRPRARTIAYSKVAAATPELPLEFAAAGELSVTPAVPVNPAAVPQGLTEAYRQWIATPVEPYCIRFGAGGGGFVGEVHEDDCAYFRSDWEFLFAMAGSIARSLARDPPKVVAIAEPERAAGYCKIPGGFLGLVGGTGTGVAHVIDFPTTEIP